MSNRGRPFEEAQLDQPDSPIGTLPNETTAYRPVHPIRELLSFVAASGLMIYGAKQLIDKVRGSES